MNIRLFAVMVLLFFLYSTASAQTYYIRVTYNTNLRSTYSLQGRIVETAPSGTTLQVVGNSGRWLKINRNGIEVWMASWVRHTRVEDQPTAPAAEVDNCCFVDRQCNTDQQWTDGYWAFQNGQCGSPSQTQTQTSTQPVSPGQSQIDNCCFVDRQCNNDQQWIDGYWAFQNGQCAAPSQTQPQTSSTPGSAHGLRIEGSDAFIGLIDEALRFLSSRSQHWYSYVTSGIDRIVEDENSYTMAALTWSRTVISAPYRRRIEHKTRARAVLTTMSSLTHEACHIHRHEAGFEYGPYTKVSEEVACIETEIEMLRAVVGYASPGIYGVIGPSHCLGSLENHPRCNRNFGVDTASILARCGRRDHMNTTECRFGS